MIACLVIVSVGVTIRKPIQWARNLQAEDIQKIEVVITVPQDGNVYRVLEQREFKDIVQRIHTSAGRYVIRPEIPGGGGFDYYITMKTGEEHVFGSNGMHVTIDGHFYMGDEELLIDWWESIIVDQPLPKDFYEKKGL